MTTLQREYKLGNTYLGFLKNLSKEVQLDIISKWKITLNEPNTIEEEKPDSYFFGAWKTSQTAEEMIADLEDSKVLTRKILNL